LWGACALGFFAASLLFTTVHELGHFFGGRSAGLTFNSMCVGPVQVSATGGRLVWSFLKRPLLGGFAVMTPADESEIRRRTIKFIAGGPIASVAVTSLLLIATFVVGDGPSFYAPAGTAGLLIRTLFYISLLTLAGTVIPYSTRSGFMTDMLLLIKLSRPGRSSEFLVAMWMLGREVWTGVRPRDWSESLISSALASAEDPDAEARALMFAANRAWDRSEYDTAQEHLDRGVAVIASLPKQHLVRNAILMMASVFFTLHAVDLGRAKECQERVFRGIELLAGSEHGMDAAVALASGLVDQALVEADKAEKELQLTKRRGVNVDAELELLTAIRQKAQAIRAHPIPNDEPEEPFTAVQYYTQRAQAEPLDR
jgi:hypothetical protein